MFKRHLGIVSHILSRHHDAISIRLLLSFKPRPSYVCVGVRVGLFSKRAGVARNQNYYVP
jgi:hypothetical protein